MKLKKSSCLVPALLQTGIMILFAAWSCIPEATLENAGLPQNYDIMPYLIPLTLLLFAWCIYMWLYEFVKTRGKETNRFGISFLLIVIDIAVMGYFMPPKDLVPERTKRAGCAVNLRKLMAALNAYEQQYGAMPPDPGEKGLELLRKTNLLPDPYALLCPGDRRSPMPAGETLTADHCSYNYTPPENESEIILRDKPGNHPGFRNEADRSGVRGIK